jgi:hypothetical protein
MQYTLCLSVSNPQRDGPLWNVSAHRSQPHIDGRLLGEACFCLRRLLHLFTVTTAFGNYIEHLQALNYMHMSSTPILWALAWLCALRSTAAQGYVDSPPLPSSVPLPVYDIASPSPSPSPSPTLLPSTDEASNSPSTTASLSASFTYPPTSPVLGINVLDSIDVEWSSNFAEAWLYLWCDEHRPSDDGTLTYECTTLLPSCRYRTS